MSTAPQESADRVDLGLRRLDAGGTQVVVEDLLPDLRAVGQLRVEVLDQRVIALGESDAVALLAERLPTTFSLSGSWAA